jgi:hypothetical protein
MTLSNAERQARWRTKRDAALKQALAQKPSAEVTKLQAENAALKGELAAVKATLARERERRVIAEAKVRTAPRTERVAEDPRIGRLQQATRELRTKHQELIRWHEAEMKRAGKMSLGTYKAVIKCLHPDQPPPTEKQRAEACALFTAHRPKP